jgi:pimeloyl-ACP methyl ester carboxylesterase
LGEQVADAAVAVGARHLVALSFGTLVALQAAIQRPSLFTSVVLAAPALAGGPQDPAVATRYIELARLYQRRGPGPHLRSLWMSSPPDIFRGAATRPVLWQQLCAIIDRHSWRELPGGQMIQLVNASHTRADLERVQAAVLVMIGEHELPAFRQSARLITSWLPNARAAAVPTAGHLCLIEEPAITARVIAEHISQSSN